MKTENISHKFSTKWIIKNFSYSFEINNLYLLTAPNGSGKTTLLRILAGELTPVNGNISLTINDKQISYNLFYKYIAFQTTAMNIPEELKVSEIVLYYKNIDLLALNPDKFYNKLNLLEYKNYKIRELSAGTQQRLLLGLTLFSKKCILIFDEPTANLDYENAMLFSKLLHTNSKDKIIIIASNLAREEKLLSALFKNIRTFSF